MILHLQTVPARNGMLWLRHGFKVFQRRPVALAGLFSLFLFASMLMLMVPGAGVLLLLMALPQLSLGFMLATHLVLQNQTPSAVVFLLPFKLTPKRRNTQLLLGACYALLTLGISLLAGWVDGGSMDQLQQLMADGAAPEKLAEAAANPALLWGAITRLVLAALISIPFWHAPALVHWGGQGLMQALFSSTIALWRNRGAFAYNALLWGTLVMSLGLSASLLAEVLGLAQILPVLGMACGLLLSTVFYASLYFTFIDCFMFGAPTELPDNKA
ncbi:BPSS1780 family membrane protein [Roseateles koreensis]|uniref:BPSS1780 family membrane protein n=1 Tax=Roseateles koreensis TaxID=2987526 RepID=A0ABT5KTM0_9BURK|nr:BPSS1780 family membrane protein [Roseateles koreensis]MDC8786287.1 BPSS1780 family membrane protein [Roseateles koreensis]